MCVFFLSFFFFSGAFGIFFSDFILPKPTNQINYIESRHTATNVPRLRPGWPNCMRDPLSQETSTSIRL
jgi:hypothetical protein